MIVSISGMENAGKTTQCNILRSQYPNVFKEIIHINNTSCFDKENFNESWWFDSGNEEAFTKGMYLCLLERIKMARNNSGITLFDKGMDFYDLKIIAVLMIKGLTFSKAKRLQTLMKNKYIQNDGEDIKLFLESSNYKNIKLDKNDPNDVRYGRYLELNRLILQGHMNKFDVIPHDKPEIVTQQILENINRTVRKEQCTKIITIKK